MPTYAYRGTECGHEFETYQSFSDDPLVECLECGGPVRRVISGVGVTFKGSGFYRTDSRAEGTKAGKGKGTGGSDSA
ncbi:MAG: FmdB family transcriptional regulator, partial [Salana multivorans]|nr:FmdB family transcriptional regulator [Salana multivorans]